MSAVQRIILIVLDSVGCGDAPDAAAYGDEGSNTLGNLGKAVGGLKLPVLGRLGLGNLTQIEGVSPTLQTLGAYGRLTAKSAGKDTTTGHWELGGIILEAPFPVYPHGFPADVMHTFETAIGCKTLGNYPASGTEILKVLGEEHFKTGKPIIYTSADSVFQIAAHEEIIPVEKLYQMCEVARELLQGKHGVGRVIARPFVGQPGNFARTEGRRDFSLEPPKETILDVLKANGKEVVGVGKIEDIFAHRGLTASNHTGNNLAGIKAILELLETNFGGLVFANLVDFDALYGHRNNTRGYADALEVFDLYLPDIMKKMGSHDLLIITADHGNDPTTPSTDHSRERVPILIYGKPIKPGINIGTRETFADVAATIGGALNIDWKGSGYSIIPEVILD